MGIERNDGREWMPIPIDGPVGLGVAFYGGRKFWSRTALYGLTNLEYRSACGAVESALDALHNGRALWRNLLLAGVAAAGAVFLYGVGANSPTIQAIAGALTLMATGTLLGVCRSRWRIDRLRADQALKGRLIDALGQFEAATSRQLVDRVSGRLGLDQREAERAFGVLEDLQRVGVFQRNDQGLYLFSPAPFATYRVPWAADDAPALEQSERRAEVVRNRGAERSGDAI